MPEYLMLLAPLAVGLAIGVSAWVLAAGRSDSVAEGEAGTRGTANKACDHCGSLVLDDWRLCPECGGFIDGSDSAQATVPSGVHLSD